MYNTADSLNWASYAWNNAHENMCFFSVITNSESQLFFGVTTPYRCQVVYRPFLTAQEIWAMTFTRNYWLKQV